MGRRRPNSTEKDLRRLLNRFSFGKDMGREAVTKVFGAECCKKKRDGSENPGKDLIERRKQVSQLFKRWEKWRDEEWLARVVIVAEELMGVIFPDLVTRHAEEGFKLMGKRATLFGGELSEFVSFCGRANEGKLVDQRINALESVIATCCVDASLRNVWIRQLVELCRTHQKIPRSLEIKDITYKNHPFATGGSAEIYMAELDGEEVAVKFPSAFVQSKMAEKKKIWGPLHEEALNWIGLCHPGVNPFLGITYRVSGELERIGLVFKYQHKGSVSKFLAEQHRSDFVRNQFFHVISAVHFLHESDLIHGDIKGDNILVGEHRKPLLTDFGLMKYFAASDSTEEDLLTTGSSVQTGSGAQYTVRFASKERVWDARRSREDDVWALAMTMIELLTGKVPFWKEGPDTAFLLKLYSGNLKLERSDLPEDAQQDLFDIINRVLVQDPKERPTAVELYNSMSEIAGEWALRDLMTPT